MAFHPENNPRLGSAFFNREPLILFWITGILLGLSYLAMPGYLFWTLLASFGLLIALFGNLRYGYYLIMLMLPVDRAHIAFTLGNISSYQVLILPYVFPLCITFGAWLVARSWKSEIRSRTAPISGLLFFMVAYMLISLIWAPHFNLGSILAVSLMLNFLVYYVTRNAITDGETLRKAAFAWTGMGLITATGVILSKWYSYDYSKWFSSRLHLEVNFGEMNNRLAGFGGSDFMGGLLVSSVFMTAAIWMVAKRREKKFFLALLIIYQVVAVIETASRGSLIGLVAGIILLIIIHPYTKNRILKYSLLTFFLIGAIILLAKPTYIDRILVGFGYTGKLYFSDRSYTGNTDASTDDISGMAGRKKMWKAGFQEMLNHPYKLILGLGVGGFITFSGAIYTHSVPLSFFFDVGLVGALIFIVLAILLFNNFSRYLRRAKRTDSYYIFMAAVAAFVAEVGVHGLIDYDFYSHGARMFWFPLAYVCATLNVMMSENPELS